MEPRRTLGSYAAYSAGISYTSLVPAARNAIIRSTSKLVIRQGLLAARWKDFFLASMAPTPTPLVTRDLPSDYLLTVFINSLIC